MNRIQIFNSPEFGQVRTVIIHNAPWFVGKDIAEILGYAEPRSTVSKKVDNEDRGVAKIETPSGIQEMTVINESGLYSLVLGSKLPASKKFKRWITSEVIPSIRKYGMYATDELLDNPDLLIQVATALKEEREKNQQLETEVKVKTQLIGELKPKADYMDQILNNKGLVTITQIAKDYGMSGQVMNELLHKLKVQYKQSDQWLLYSKYHDMGYTHSNTVGITRKDGTPDIKMNTKWTQKGRLFLYELLKANNYLPVIEQN